ncbi:MAG: hypothetical protein LBJ04_10445, partial [Sphingobacterium sp.]|nr:hypothetical protein [Sphingobacterium sp.]
EQSSQARQSRWYCRNRWESRSVPFFTRKPLLETVKGFFRFSTFRVITLNLVLIRATDVFENDIIMGDAIMLCS